MTEQEWLTSDDPVAMLDWLYQNHTPSDRKLRLWVVACRSLEMFKAKQMNRYTPDGKDLEGKWEALEKAISAWKEASESPVVPSLHERTHILRDIIGNPFQPVTCRTVEPCKACEFRKGVRLGFRDKAWAAARDSCPCGGKQVIEASPPWLTPLVLQLAEAAYTVRTGTGTLDNDALAVLSDALEEAGLGVGRVHEFNNGGVAYWVNDTVPTECHLTPDRAATHPILAHLREHGPHYRGCWAVDLLLGKE